jgi:hypothetical protein
MDTDLQLSYTYTRPKESLGWKIGAGPQGGKSFFGSNAASPDGYVVHRFWPQAYTSGHIISKGKAIDAKGTGMFIHAIQGMRPNLIASRWNFANFQSTSGPEKVAAIMMEFTTTSDYGGPVIRKNEKEGTSKRDTISVNIGSITVGGQLVAVTAASRKASASDDELSKGSHTIVQHLDPVLDSETGYKVPQTVRYAWQGPLLKDGKAQSDVVEAELKVDLGKPTPSEAKGLIEKVDVLGEIPLLVRKVVNYVAGTKPYVYQVGVSSRLETLFVLMSPLLCSSLTPQLSRLRFLRLTVATRPTISRSPALSSTSLHSSRRLESLGSSICVLTGRLIAGVLTFSLRCRGIAYSVLHLCVCLDEERESAGLVNFFRVVNA